MKLLNERLTKRPFVALATEDDHFVADLIVGHGEVVAALL